MTLYPFGLACRSVVRTLSEPCGKFMSPNYFRVLRFQRRLRPWSQRFQFGAAQRGQQHVAVGGDA